MNDCNFNMFYGPEAWSFAIESLHCMFVTLPL